MFSDDGARDLSSVQALQRKHQGFQVSGVRVARVIFYLIIIANMTFMKYASLWYCIHFTCTRWLLLWFCGQNPKVCRISGDKQGVFATLEPRRQLDLVNFHQDVWVISEFTQQNGRKKRTAKRLSVTNMTGLLLSCFVGNSLNIDVFCSSTKRSVWRNVKFGRRFFQTKLFSRLTHNVCRRLSSLSSLFTWDVQVCCWSISFFVYPATFPEFFAKINSSQFPSRF